MKKLSIIIPAYNEEAFLEKLLNIIFTIDTESIGFEKEIIVVNDGSLDKTPMIMDKFKDKIFRINQKNQGKGAAVQNGISKSTGNWILVQDADLEYDPNDYLKMLKAINNQEKIAVYGSRIKGQIKNKKSSILFPGKHKDQGIGPWIAGIILSLWCFLLYGKFITDTLTAYKIYPAKIIKSFKVKTCGFETDHELTAKLIRKRIKIIEVPIDYTPRSKEEGKKIKAKDGFIAFWTFFRFRF